jgi:hypothetical protein
MPRTSILVTASLNGASRSTAFDGAGKERCATLNSANTATKGSLMTTTLESPRSASTRRMALWGLSAFLAVLMAGTLVLWLTLGSALFYEVVAAGIAYCF